MASSQRFDLFRSIYGEGELPRPFDLILVAQGQPEPPRFSPAARKIVEEIRASSHQFNAALGLASDYEPDDKARTRERTMLGQLLLGVLAERAFESIYKTTLGTTELALEDSREARNDTDYRVLNGQHRPVFRINIKFHGTLFRQAKTLVGLEPEDCFALATYKIKQGMDKQEKEVLPYLFVVVSCPVSALDVGRAIPSDIIELAAAIRASKRVSGKRSLEEKIVEHLLGIYDASFARMVTELREKLSTAPWRVLSARRADDLLRDNLFERVYAVRVRGFTRSYRNAEVDMHFSLSQDMTTLQDFLRQVAEIGLHGMAGKLERGLL
jgi:hypothetical protein